MKRIETVFKKLEEKGRKALIAFAVAGDPDLETTEALVLKMAECGADIIELGVPYSDPLADGPTIQAASQRALKNGVPMEDLVAMAERLKGKTPPLVFLTYFNSMLQYGLERFAAACQRGGIAGVIAADLPPEEAGAWIKAARRRKVDTVFLASPTSPPERLGLICRLSRGFVYYVSVTGVTGTRGALPEGLEEEVRRLKKTCGRPVAVGFGISTPEQAAEVARFADGVIVGSALVKILEEESERGARLERVGNFISSLARAIRSPGAPSPRTG